MNRGQFEAVFSDAAIAFVFALPKRRQAKVVELVRQLALHPRVRSDYALPDELGRQIHHLMIEDYVFAYWLDEAVRELRIVDIEDAS